MTACIGKWKNYIYRGLYALVYCGIFLAAGHAYLGIPQVTKRHIPVAAFLLVLLFVFCAMNLRGKLLLAAGGLAALSVAFLINGWEGSVGFCREYLDWALGKAASPERLFLFQCVQLLWLVLFSTVLAFLGEAFRPVHLTMLGGILIGAVVCMVYGWEVPRIGMAFFYTFLLLNVSEIAENHWKKERKGQGSRAYMVWLWPVWLLCLSVLYLTPSSPEPYDWEFVQTIYSRVSEKWTVLSQRIGKLGAEDFDIRMSGFEEESVLGGNLAKDQTTFFLVSSQVTSKNNLYLAGMAMDTFDGRDWEVNGEERRDSTRLDALETLYAVEAFDAEHADRYVDSRRLRLEQKYFRSEFFFTPIKTVELEWEQTNLLTGEEQSNKIWEQAKNYGDTYSVYYYQLNGDRERIRELVNGKQAFDETLWRSVCRQYHCEWFTAEELEKYRESVRNTYGQQFTLSPEAAAWVEQVTTDCETPLERLYAMESALQKMKYTTTPGKLPGKVDTPEEFVDYLLLQKQEGYCTYFATAFVMLARAEGFPARFVKGFSVPMEGSREALVTGDMAHAWAEVYFEGVGWIPFEPTPGYDRMRYTPWKEKETVKRNPGEVNYPEPEQPKEEVREAELTVEEQKGDSGPLLWGIAVFLILLAMIFVTDLLISRRRYARSSLQEKFLRQAQRDLLIAGKLGVKRTEGETLQEFGAKLEEALAKTWESSPVFWRMYEEVLYGELPVTEEMVIAARAERKKLMESLGRRDHLIERYQLFREG